MPITTMVIAREVLVVDDEPVVRSQLVQFLSRYGYHVSDAATVHEAKQILKEQRPAVVVADVCMPDGNGFALVDFCRREHILSQYIMISGQLPNFSTSRAIECGLAGFLRKPVRLRFLTQLLDVVHEIATHNDSGIFSGRIADVHEILLREEPLAPALSVLHAHQVVVAHELHIGLPEVAAAIRHVCGLAARWNEQRHIPCELHLSSHVKENCLVTRIAGGCSHFDPHEFISECRDIFESEIEALGYQLPIELLQPDSFDINLEDRSVTFLFSLSA